MSLEAILAEIEAAGEAQVMRLRAEAESRVGQIQAEAERAASARREEARRAALLPAAGERARLLHHARLEALRVKGGVRDALVQAALIETRRRLAAQHADRDYPVTLRRLTEEAIDALGEQATDGGRVLLAIDPRDEALIRRILHDLGLDLPIQASLECWGGVAARSGDGRIVATNTLEARLERAMPFLRRDLAAFFETEPAGIRETQETAEEAVDASVASFSHV